MTLAKLLTTNLKIFYLQHIINLKLKLIKYAKTLTKD